MSLVRIFPDKPGYDQRTFECPRCEHEITEIVQLPKAG
jgi:transcription elongation factor Elf1